jgi:hypothetical protein
MTPEVHAMKIGKERKIVEVTPLPRRLPDVDREPIKPEPAERPIERREPAKV